MAHTARTHPSTIATASDRRRAVAAGTADAADSAEWFTVVSATAETDADADADADQTSTPTVTHERLAAHFRG